MVNIYMNIKCLVLPGFIVAIIGLASCKNNDEVFKPVVSTYLNIVNASADTLNFYLNGTRQNNGSSFYPGSQSFYLVVPAGQQNYQFKKAGNPFVLFSVPLTLKDSVNNSLYIAGESPDKTFSTLDSLFIDTVANTTQVRFANASPDAGNLSVKVGDTVNFKARSFKTSSVFLPTGSGLKRVQIYLEGAAVPRVDTTIAFNPGRIYTLFSKGLINGKGSSVFGVGLIINY
jgi:hypothetical protein